MKKIDIETVNYIANLAKLKFSEEESLKLAHEFESILTNFETLDKLETIFFFFSLTHFES